MRLAQLRIALVAALGVTALFSATSLVASAQVQQRDGAAISSNSSNSSNSTTSTISRSDVIARARAWLSPQVPYDQGGSHLGYRTDCSGYVSWAWGLSSSLNTLGLAGANVSQRIGKDDLRQGDIVDNPDGGGIWGYAHVLIFDSWVDSGHTHYNAYEENTYWHGAHYTQNIPYPFWPGDFDQKDYAPFRLRGIDGSSTPQEPARDGEEYVNQSANPTVTQAGQGAQIYFTERNTGNRAWSDGDGYRLTCYSNCFGLKSVGFGGRSVGPTGIFQFIIGFPTLNSPGTYRTSWAMEHNGNRFGHYLWIDLVVQAYIPPPPACSTPMLQSPWAGTTFGASPDVTLSWSTNCPKSYTELWGGPYSTLNFGGWQGRNGIHIGQMNPGAYTWHVQGQNANGSTTGWSASWTFTVNASAPVVTPTPITPTVTPSSGPVATPYLFSPQDGATFTLGQSTYLAFNYHAIDDEGYVELLTPTGGVVNFGGWSHTTIVNTGPLNSLGLYRWHAKARDTSGHESVWSDFSTFTVIPAPTPTPSTLSGNLAPQASRSAGSGAVVDGNLGTEWIGGHGTSSITFSWSVPVTIHRIVVWDRSQSSSDNNQINGLGVTMSNGFGASNVDMISGGPRCADINFSNQTVTSVTIYPNDASGNNGYKEIEIWASTGPQSSGNSCSNTRYI